MEEFYKPLIAARARGIKGTFKSNAVFLTKEEIMQEAAYSLIGAIVVGIIWLLFIYEE